MYLLECRNGRLYTGIAVNVRARFLKHSSGKGAMFTRLNPPSHIIGTRQCRNRSEASKMEAALKRLNREQKREAVAQWPVFKDEDD